MAKQPRAAVYIRVSRLDQDPQNQRLELERLVEFRRWDPTWFVEQGVSGSKEQRPVLDAMMRDVRRGKFDVVVCLKLDRLGRNLGHLIKLTDELKALRVDFATMDGIDTTTPHGELQF